MSDTDFDLNERIKELQKSSEAGVALVTVAVIDQWLNVLMLTAMRDLSNNVSDRIFGSRGPLYDLAPKVDVAFGFRLIEEDVLSDIRLLRDIRNKFAHTQEVLHFESPAIDALCRNLSGWKPGVNNSELFHKVAFDCVQKIDAKTEQLTFEYATEVGDAAD
jgi:DNA-binding MltR family transcriptional regulator